MALMVLAAASIFMATLDYSMLNISLPEIAKYFGIKLITLSWLPLTYLSDNERASRFREAR